MRAFALCVLIALTLGCATPGARPSPPAPAPAPDAGDALVCRRGEAPTAPTPSPDRAWGFTRTPPAPGDLLGVTYASGQFVAVGAGGIIRTSPDGATWTDRTSGTTRDLHAITYHFNRFVAVGDHGTVLTSTDGVDWEKGQSGTQDGLQTVAAGQGLVLASGGQTIFEYVHGMVWGTCTFRADLRIRSLTWGGGEFVAVAESLGDEGGWLILRSKHLDGWVVGARLPHKTTQGLAAAAGYGDAGFVVLTGLDAAALSADGTVWEERPFSYQFGGGHWGFSSIAYGNGRYVAVHHVCDPGGCSSNLAGSADGAAWQRLIYSEQPLQAVAYGDGMFVAVGARGTTVVVSGFEK